MPTTASCDGIHVHALPAARGSALRTWGPRVATVAVVAGGAWLLVPRLGEVERALGLLAHGSAGWIALAVLGAVAMHLAYVELAHAVLGADRARVGRGAAATIALAGLAANRVVSAGGAGGVALTAWELRRRGLAARRVAGVAGATVVATYVPYVAAVAVCGLALAAAGAAPDGMALWPGVAAVGVLLAAGAIALAGPRAGRPGDALRGAGAVLDPRRGTALLAALAYWAAQVLVLWCVFRALGVDAPGVVVLVQAFFLGMLGNLLPAPGGVGGVEGGMVAALVALGTATAPALAAVVAYRLLTNWLPLVPCLIALGRLRRVPAPAGPAAA